MGQLLIKIVRIHALILLPYLAGMMFLGATHHIVQFAIGALLAGANLLVVLWSAQQLLLKKPIALLVTVSVIKYGLLITLAIYAIAARWTMSVGFLIGISTLLPSLVVLAYLINKNGIKWFTSTGHN